MASFSEYQNTQPLSLTDLKGQDFLVVFWGADLPEKRERSILILKQIQELRPFLQQRNIRLLSINVQGDSSATIAGVQQEINDSDPVFIDSSGESYGALGIYVMPALLLVDKTGLVVAGLGYSHNSVARLKGEIEILRGEKERVQVEDELQPKMVEQTPQEKEADQHLNFGQIMRRKGRSDSAIREFSRALALVPDLAPAIIALGCLSLETGDTARAEKLIGQALVLTPDSLPARICLARLTAGQDRPEQARIALERLLAENPHVAEIAYHLGKLQEDQGQTRQAAQYYRRAYELLRTERGLSPAP
jgi:tetratricopeptide (TPR) repeat protein